MNAMDCVSLALHFCLLSVLSVGGAMSIVPDMHRYLVNEHQLLPENVFSESVTLAQIAPGPNILLVAVMGWNLGLRLSGAAELNALGLLQGLALASLLLLCAVIPSSLLTYNISQWLQRHQQAISVRAFKAGMVPLVTGLMLSAGWLLHNASNPQMEWQLVLMCLISLLLVWFTRIHILWLILGGAITGAALGL